MRYHKQTRLRAVDELSGITIDRGNPLAAIIASILDLDSPEDAIQIQEHYDSGEATWVILLSKWLEDRGWDWGSLEDHQYDDSLYLVYGVSPRSTTHVCIYKNGKLFHDPYPGDDESKLGLVTEETFEFLEPIPPQLKLN